MKYGDEDKIAIRRESIKQSAWDISAEIEIDGRMYSFSERELTDCKVAMILPEQFAVMSAENARMKYPSEFRPDLILTSMGKSVDFTFKYMPREVVEPEEIRTYTENLRMASKRMNPAAIYDDVKVVEAINRNIPHYSYQVAAFDADIYGIVFTASVAGHLLLGGFNCDSEKREPWEILVKQMLRSIRFLDAKDTV